MAPSIDQIIKGVSIVAQEYPNIKKAELFGSLARGQGRADSVVDLLIRIYYPTGVSADTERSEISSGRAARVRSRRCS